MILFHLLYLSDIFLGLLNSFPLLSSPLLSSPYLFRVFWNDWFYFFKKLPLGSL